jgi:hypothetical protein
VNRKCNIHVRLWTARVIVGYCSENVFKNKKYSRQKSFVNLLLPVRTPGTAAAAKTKLSKSLISGMMFY